MEKMRSDDSQIIAIIDMSLEIFDGFNHTIVYEIRANSSLYSQASCIDVIEIDKMLECCLHFAKNKIDHKHTNILVV